MTADRENLAQVAAEVDDFCKNQVNLENIYVNFMDLETSLDRHDEIIRLFLGLRILDRAARGNAGGKNFPEVFAHVVAIHETLTDSSRKSDLRQDVYAAYGAIAARNGDVISALSRLETIDGSSAAKKYPVIMDALLLAGRHRLVRDCLTDLKDLENKECDLATTLELTRIFRLCGDCSSARELFDGLQSPGSHEDHRDRYVMEEQLIQRILSGDTPMLVRRLAKARIADLGLLLEVHLWAIIGAVQSRRLKPLTQIRREIPNAPDKEQLLLLHDLVQTLQQADVEILQDVSGMNQIEASMNSINHIRSAERQILAWGAAGSHLHRVGYSNLARFSIERYREMSKKLNGVHDDALLIDSQIKRPKTDVVMHDLTVRKDSFRKFGARMAKEVLIGRLKRTFQTEEKAKQTRTQTIAACIELLSKEGTALRGGIGKMLQLGIGVTEAFPEELRSMMQQIYDSNQPAGPGISEAQISKSLDASPYKLFKEWNPTPFAAGTIGQVHKATAPDGSAIAVKVKYPHAETAIRSDMKTLNSLSWLLNVVFGTTDVANVIQNWQKMLLLECDYTREVEAQDAFCKACEGDDLLAVPKLRREFCGRSVITMDFVEGQHFYDFLESANQELKNKAGRAILRSGMIGMAIGCFRYDFHPGNYLFTDNAVSMVDFGATVRQNESWVDLLDWLDSVKSKDKTRFNAILNEFGMFPDPKKYDFEDAIKINREIFLKPFLTPGPQKVDMATVSEFIQNYRKRRVKGAIQLPARPHMIRIFSMYRLLSELNAEVDFMEEMKRLKPN